MSKKRAVPSIITMSEERPTAVRKLVGRALTTNSLLDYEDSIETNAHELVECLNKQGNVLDIGLWLQFFAMDVLFRITFGETLGLLAKGDDIDGVLAAVLARFDHWGRWGAMPSADYLLNKTPIAMKLSGISDSPIYPC
ncbi:hypothetical protein GGR51DRAFT_540277 [Nemania sp. FL0031]|nr:hypothetical protein GGR51DRAFT_540277 [Nemania sp. FL0031]